jgi:hypothetical protein
MGIIAGELPFIATTNAMMDNCITYWGCLGTGIQVTQMGGIWLKVYVWTSL